MDRAVLFDNVYTTENGIFAIDCGEIHTNLVPNLDDIISSVSYLLLIQLIL